MAKAKTEPGRNGPAKLLDNAEIANRFTYHKPKKGQPERYEDVRTKARSLAHCINDNCPPGRETALAITKLQEAVMWANAAIALE